MLRSTRATAVAALLTAALTACTSAGETRCSAPLPFSYETPVLEMVRVYTGADGLSHAEVQKITGETTTYLGALLRQFQLGDPSNVVIVSGPPDFRIAVHPAPYREMFLILAGSSIIELSDGTEQPLNPGSWVLFEDTTGPGHGGRFGPCGYVAVDLQFKNAPVPASTP